MRIAYVSAGTGSFHCGISTRDVTLANGLAARGHHVRLVTVYLPLVTDALDPAATPPLFISGITTYLQQNCGLLRDLPRWCLAPLERPGLLRWASGMADMTRTRGRGPMTASMLEGLRGRQAGELRRLLAWLARHERPDVVVLCSVLLSGFAAAIRSVLGVPVVCWVGGEEGFVDGLDEDWSTACWRLLHGNLRGVSGLLSLSDYCSGVARQRLAVSDERIHRVYPGLDLSGFDPAVTGPAVPTIGFLAHLNPIKGLHTLVEAFCLLKRRPGRASLRLRVAGTCNWADRGYLARQRRRLEGAGLGDDVEILPNPDRAAKIGFLRGCSLLCVAPNYAEAFGLYLIEALASGLPVVVPDRGAIPEVLAALGGHGHLYAVDDGGGRPDPAEAEKLAEALAAALDERSAVRHTGPAERERPLATFTVEAFTERAERALTAICDRYEEETMEQALISMRGVSKRFGGSEDVPGQTVLDGVDLEVQKGESLAIVGPSGAGKSTALNLLGALDQPTAGSVILDGQDLSTLGEEELAAVRSRKLGFIFQDHHLLPQCTVRENVLLPTLAFGGAGAEHYQRADGLLERVGLDQRGDDWPRYLSGGERQRVAVIRALINQPVLILADEPTGALDRSNSDALTELLLELQRESGTTLVVVTHQLEQARRLDRVLELRDGDFAPLEE